MMDSLVDNMLNFYNKIKNLNKEEIRLTIDVVISLVSIEVAIVEGMSKCLCCYI